MPPASIQAAGWKETLAFPVPIAHAGETFTISLELTGGGDGVGAIVDIDNLHFVPEPSRQGIPLAGLLGLFLIRSGRLHSR